MGVALWGCAFVHPSPGPTPGLATLTLATAGLLLGRSGALTPRERRGGCGLADRPTVCLFPSPRYVSVLVCQASLSVWLVTFKAVSMQRPPNPYRILTLWHRWSNTWHWLAHLGAFSGPGHQRAATGSRQKEYWMPRACGVNGARSQMNATFSPVEQGRDGGAAAPCPSTQRACLPSRGLCGSSGVLPGARTRQSVQPRHLRSYCLWSTGNRRLPWGRNSAT